MGSPKKIQKIVGCSDDDFKVLISKQFIIPFDSGIVVIRHWKIHNYIRGDRYNPTIYKQEQSLLNKDEDGIYSLGMTSGIPDVNHVVTQMDTQVRLGKDSIGKDSIDNIPPLEKSRGLSKNTKHKYGEYKNVLLTDEELEKLKQKYNNWEELIKYLDEYIEMKGYKAKSHYLAIKKWVIDAVKEKPKETKKQFQNYNQREYTNLDKLYAN